MLEKKVKEQILELANEDETSIILFETLKKYSNDNDAVILNDLLNLGDFNSFAKGKQIKIKSRISHIFKIFENLELGKYIVGRRGKPTRFEFNKEISLENIKEIFNLEEEEQKIAL